MALLSKNTRKDSSGHTYEKLGDTVFGGKLGKVNKASEFISCDYIFVYDDSCEDTVFEKDTEVGINKNYCMFHEPDWNDEHKSTNHKRDRKNKHIFDDADDIIYRLRSGRG